MLDVHIVHRVHSVHGRHGTARVDGRVGTEVEVAGSDRGEEFEGVGSWGIGEKSWGWDGGSKCGRGE